MNLTASFLQRKPELQYRDLGFFQNTRGNKAAAANLRRTGKCAMVMKKISLTLFSTGINITLMIQCHEATCII